MSHLAPSARGMFLPWPFCGLTKPQAHPQQGWRAQVTTGNLERVRKVKTRHQRLWTRVVTVREELQVRCRPSARRPRPCLLRSALACAASIHRSWARFVGTCGRQGDCPVQAPAVGIWQLRAVASV